MSDLEEMSDPELALYVSRAQTALDFAIAPEDRERLVKWLGSLEREQQWRELGRGTPRHVVAQEHSRVLADIVSAALAA